MTLRQIEDVVKAYNHKDKETEVTDGEETEVTEETTDAPKEFSVAVETSAEEELVYVSYTAEELLDLLRTATQDGIILHVYKEV